MNLPRAAAFVAVPIALVAIVVALLGSLRGDGGLSAAGGLLLAGVVGCLRWLPPRPARPAAGEAEAPTPTPADTAGPWRARVRSLERILAAASRLNATHDRSELADRVVATVAELGGFQRVQLSLWDDAVHAYVPRAFAGHSAFEVTALTAAPVPLRIFVEMTAPAYRHSNCFLVPATTGSAGLDEAPPTPIAGRWTDGLRLVAPLVAASGERFGFLSLAAPTDGRVPDPVNVHLLEFLLQQVATALESAEVYDRLAARNADLSAASRKLDSLAKMKRNFVANVSHELRTPLTSISAYSELLQANLGNLSGESLAEFLRVIHTESQRLSGVISDILEISSMEKGRPELPAAAADLTQLVRRQAESWASRASGQGVQLAVSVSDAPVWMPADQVLLRQLLDHLVDNAIKFTAAGGSVSLTVSETGTAAKVTVEDTGIGIPDDKLGEIFQSFFQVDGSPTRAHNGQGVGLAICHDIVQHHDGRIWAENLEPKGTRFTVLLPRRAPVVLNREQEDEGAGGLEPGEFLQRLMHWIGEGLGVRTAALMLPDDDEQALVIRAAIGLPGSVVQGARLRRGAGYAGRVWATGRTLLITDLTSDASGPRDTNEPRYSTPSLLCVPLDEGDRCVGVLTVNNKIDGTALDDDDRLLLEGLAPRVSGLLTRYTGWHREGLALQQVRQALRATTAVGQPHRESLHGICREICLATARRLGFEPEELAALAFALPWYDVGLSRVPPQLLARPGRLDEAEERLVQGHVASGLEILAPLAVDPRVRRLIRHHHENIDGTGYPAGLAGEAIPVGARLLRLTDTLGALLSRRPWRGAWSLDAALSELRDHAGSRYCPRLTPVFLIEVESRRARILTLQADVHETEQLRRPVLDREGMVSVRD